MNGILISDGRFHVFLECSAIVFRSHKLEPQVASYLAAEIAGVIGFLCKHKIQFSFKVQNVQNQQMVTKKQSNRTPYYLSSTGQV